MYSHGYNIVNSLPARLYGVKLRDELQNIFDISPFPVNIRRTAINSASALYMAQKGTLRTFYVSFCAKRN